jgi:exopolysaccharide biosynthesis polyprenyl glycosylphosphotransferase
MSTTLFEDMGAKAATLEGARALPAIRTPLRRRDRVLAAIVRVAVVFVPAAVVLAAFGGGWTGLLDAGAIGAIWFLTLRSARTDTSSSQRALGPLVSSGLGTLAGLAAASAAVFWTPVLNTGPLELLLIAPAVFLGTIAFEGLFSDRVSPRSRVLVVGLEGGGAELVRDLAADARSPFECTGLVRFASEDDVSEAAPLVGTTAELSDILVRERPDLVVLSTGERRTEVLASLLDAASLDFRVVDLHHFYEHAFGRVPVHNLSPVWFMSLLHLYQRPYSRAAKRAFDLSVAALVLLITAPLFPVVASLVRRSSPGPILFRQTRLGEGGQTFEMLKFRTMVDHAEEPGTPVWAQQSDPRLTPAGQFLRKVRLDELPQLWNVLRGDMSIVGPRPERPEFVELLEAEVPFWKRRHLVKPGISGWAQVRRGYTSDIQGTAEKLSYDLYYIKHRSLAFDLAIAARTVGIMFAGRERRELTGVGSAQA